MYALCLISEGQGERDNMAKRKQKEMFIIVAGETPYVRTPDEQGFEMQADNNLPDLPDTIKKAQHLLKLWQQYDAEIGGPDDPPMDFKIYLLTEVK